MFRNIEEISLILSDSHDENYLKITKLPEMEKLKSLQLGYSSADYANTANQLMRDISKSKYFINLKKLVWIGSAINKDGMEELCKSPFITKLHTFHIFENMGTFGDEEVKLLANSENFQHLTDLVLVEHGEQYTEEAVRYLSNGKYSNNLTSLSLDHYQYISDSPNFKKLKSFCYAYALNEAVLSLSQSQYLEELEEIQRLFHTDLCLESDGLKALSMSTSIKKLNRLCISLSPYENEECAQYLMSSNFINVKVLFGKFETSFLKSIAFSSAIRFLDTIECFMYFLNEDFFEVLSHPRFKLKKLAVKTMTSAKLDFTKSAFKNSSFLAHLQHLELANIQMGIEGLRILFSGNNSKSLKYLSFSGCNLGREELNIISASENLHSLESLVLENNALSTGKISDIIVENSMLTNLKSLTLRRFGLTDSDLKLLADSSLGRKLRELIITDEDKITTIGLYSVLEKLTGLKTLHLIPIVFDNFSEATILHYLSSFNNLNEFYVGHMALKNSVQSMGIFYNEEPRTNN